MIKLQAIGYLGKDAESKQFDNGKTVINFSVAHSEKYKDKSGNQQSKTTWVECAYWTERTGLLPYLKKGTMVYVEGQPEARGFQKADGSTTASLVVRVMNIQLLGGGKQSEQAVNQVASPAATNQPVFDDDLPF